MKEEIEIKDPESEQISYTIFPKDAKYADIDVIRMRLESIEGEAKTVDMTPDEAMLIISGLSHAVSIWMLESEEYKPLNDRRKKIAKDREVNL